MARQVKQRRRRGHVAQPVGPTVHLADEILDAVGKLDRAAGGVDKQCAAGSDELLDRLLFLFGQRQSPRAGEDGELGIVRRSLIRQVRDVDGPDDGNSYTDPITHQRGKSLPGEGLGVAVGCIIGVLQPNDRHIHHPAARGRHYDGDRRRRRRGSVVLSRLGEEHRAAGRRYHLSDQLVRDAYVLSGFLGVHDCPARRIGWRDRDILAFKLNLLSDCAAFDGSNLSIGGQQVDPIRRHAAASAAWAAGKGGGLAGRPEVHAAGGQVDQVLHGVKHYVRRGLEGPTFARELSPLPGQRQVVLHVYGQRPDAVGQLEEVQLLGVQVVGIVVEPVVGAARLQGVAGKGLPVELANGPVELRPVALSDRQNHSSLVDVLSQLRHFQRAETDWASARNVNYRRVAPVIQGRTKRGYLPVDAVFVGPGQPSGRRGEIARAVVPVAVELELVEKQRLAAADKEQQREGGVGVGGARPVGCAGPRASGALPATEPLDAGAVPVDAAEVFVPAGQGRSLHAVEVVVVPLLEHQVGPIERPPEVLMHPLKASRNVRVHLDVVAVDDVLRGGDVVLADVERRDAADCHRRLCCIAVVEPAIVRLHVRRAVIVPPSAVAVLLAPPVGLNSLPVSPGNVQSAVFSPGANTQHGVLAVGIVPRAAAHLLVVVSAVQRPEQVCHVPLKGPEVPVVGLLVGDLQGHRPQGDAVGHA